MKIRFNSCLKEDDSVDVSKSNVENNMSSERGTLLRPKQLMVTVSAVD
jgi:hypothetical protein